MGNFIKKVVKKYAIDHWYHCLTSSEFLMSIWGIVDMYQVKAWAIYFILSL